MRNNTIQLSSADIIKTMDNCTKCGICNAYCPVANVTNEFPGPKYTGPQTQRFRSIQNLYEISPELCNGCGICMSVCPNDVAITDIITIAKSNIKNKNRKISLLQKILNRPEIIGKIGNIFPLLSNFIINNIAFRKFAEKILNLSYKAPLPYFAGNKFKSFQKSNEYKNKNKTIIYFSGCAVDHYDQDLGIVAIKIMEFLGYNVNVITDLCCSLPMLSSGECNSAIKRSTRLINIFSEKLNLTDKIISTSTSCSLTIKKKYSAYLDLTDEKSLNVSNSTYDICEYILENHIVDLKEKLDSINMKIFYHGPCQLRNHGMGQPAVQLLKLIPDISISISESECCGIGGTFGYEKNNNKISNEISKTLLNQIKKEKPDIILCDSETCRWNIEKFSGIKTIHPIQLLSKSLKIN